MIRGAETKDRPVASEALYFIAKKPFYLKAWLDYPWKLILHREEGSIELYNLESDPKEERNIASAFPEQVRSLQGRLLRLLPKRSPAEPSEQSEAPLDDPRLEEQLRALGYIQ
jgi:hypothetical protein